MGVVLQSWMNFQLCTPHLVKAIDALNTGYMEFQNKEIDITKDIGAQLPSNSEYLLKVSNYFSPEMEIIEIILI